MSFTKKSLDFLKTAGQQKSVKWLDEHKAEHRDLIVMPMQELALYLRDELYRLPEARGVKFPVRGFGRLRRPKHKVQPGQPAYRNFVHMSASVPSKSIFDENPGLYFYLSPEDIFAGGGLYEASSRQVKQIRQWIDNDARDLDRVLKSKPFSRVFPAGLSTDEKVKTNPRLYPPTHKRIELLRLQAYYVTRKFTRKQLLSKEFDDLLLESWKQSLKLNAVLNEAMSDWNQTLAPVETTAVDDDAIESGSSGDLWDDRL